MRRRVLLQWAAAAIAYPRLGLAQAQRRFRVGILWMTDAASVKAPGGAFLAGLQDLGYAERKNLVVDVRYARGDYDRVPALADELIALQPDVLVAIESVAVVIRSKTTTIPIVLVGGPDPVAAGLVKTASRPGTNVTGNAFRQDELIAKQIELLTELFPQMSRVALLNFVSFPGEAVSGSVSRYEDFARAAAAKKGLTLSIVAARDPKGLQRAFAELEKARPQGLVVASGGFMYQHRQTIVDAARRLRLPSISALPQAWLEAGGLLNYGPDFVRYYRYAATFVDRIFRGTSPAEIPIEYTATFELGINLKTAREIGVTIPRAIMLRADRVID